MEKCIAFQLCYGIKWTQFIHGELSVQRWKYKRHSIYFLSNLCLKCQLIHYYSTCCVLLRYPKRPADGHVELVENSWKRKIIKKTQRGRNCRINSAVKLNLNWTFLLKQQRLTPTQVGFSSNVYPKINERVSRLTAWLCSPLLTVKITVSNVR